jgi:K+-sensing histidine kinase KdpD
MRCASEAAGLEPGRDNGIVARSPFTAAGMTALRGHLSRDWAAMIAAFAAPLVAAGLLLPFRASWPNTNVALLLVVVIVAVAALGNRVAGALAAIWTALCFDFFFTVPYERFTIRRSSDVVTFALLFVVGVAVSQLAARARTLKLITVTDARYLELIHKTADLAQSAAPSAVIDQVTGQLTSLLDLRDCRFEYGKLMGSPARLEPDGTVTTRHGRWDADQFGLPAGETEIRTFAGGQYYGRFMLTPNPDARPSRQARLVAVTLAETAGRAIAASMTSSDAV